MKLTTSLVLALLLTIYNTLVLKKPHYYNSAFHWKSTAWLSKLTAIPCDVPMNNLVILLPWGLCKFIPVGDDKNSAHCRLVKRSYVKS